MSDDKKIWRRSNEKFVRWILLAMAGAAVAAIWAMQSNVSAIGTDVKWLVSEQREHKGEFQTLDTKVDALGDRVLTLEASPRFRSWADNDDG